MSEPNVILKFPDIISDSKGYDLISNQFHKIHRIIPQKQILCHVTPDTPVSNAVELMLQNNFSQLPIVKEGKYLGVFNFRTFTKDASGKTLEVCKKDQYAPGDLSVIEYSEKPDPIHPNHELLALLRLLEDHSFALIGSHDHITNIVTCSDLSKYLFNAAHPFLLLSEIELSLRDIIRKVLTDEQIEFASARCLKPIQQGNNQRPKTIKEMSFEDYKSIISFKDIWPNFIPIFGAIKGRTTSKLLEIREIRNDMFHFKREMTIQDHQILLQFRNTLLTKIESTRMAEAGDKI